jgi:predicted GIY-YIG superfamily endonuclease
MHYVYLLQSEGYDGQRYVGITVDLRKRIVDHNAGKSSAHVQICTVETGDLRGVL